MEKYFDEADDKQVWFDKIKAMSVEFGYAGEVKEFKENRFRYSADRWFRSPCVPYSNYFCYWYANGYVNSGNAANTCTIPLCFCIGNKSA